MSKSGGKPRRQPSGRRPLVRPTTDATKQHPTFRDRRWAR